MLPLFIYSLEPFVKTRQHWEKEHMSIEGQSPILLVLQISILYHHLFFFLADQFPLLRLEHAVFEYFIFLYLPPTLNLLLVHVSSVKVDEFGNLVVLEVLCYLHIFMHMINWKYLTSIFLSDRVMIRDSIVFIDFHLLELVQEVTV